MDDRTIINVLMQYGTVVNIRRQYHAFDKNIETGVRSCLVKNLKKQIPSFVRVGGYSLSVRYRGQEKNCKVCDQVGHFSERLPLERQ